ncbi:MAG: hypothetical protein FJ304_19490 [Planctomycetes bacterium]|nr:hypothetical protein [Planctomycetota bacterium]
MWRTSSFFASACVLASVMVIAGVPERAAQADDVKDVRDQIKQLEEEKAKLWARLAEVDAQLRKLNDKTGGPAKEPTRFREVHSWYLRGGGLTTSATVSLDGRRIFLSEYSAYAPKGGGIRAFDAATGKVLFKFEKCESFVFQFVFSRDGKRIVAGCRDKSLKMWDAETGKLLRSFDGHNAEVVSVDLSADDNYIVSCAGESSAEQKVREIHVWDAETGKLLRTIAPEKTVSRVAISPDKKRIVGSMDGYLEPRKIVLWELETGKKTHVLTDPDRRGVLGARYSRDGKRIIGLTDTLGQAVDASIIEWDAETGEHLRTLKGPKGWYLPFVISPDGKYIASGSRDESLLLWDAQTARVLAVGKLPKGEGPGSIAFSPDGAWLVEGNRSYNATIWAIIK